MATVNIEAGNRWRKSILLRLAELELNYSEVPINHNKSTYVIRYGFHQKQAVDTFMKQIKETEAQIAQERRDEELQKQLDKEAKDLIWVNIGRVLTFRKPLKTIGA